MKNLSEKVVVVTYVNPLLERLALTPMEPDEVGEMVCNAIVVRMRSCARSAGTGRVFR